MEELLKIVERIEENLRLLQPARGEGSLIENTKRDVKVLKDKLNGKEEDGIETRVINLSETQFDELLNETMGSDIDRPYTLSETSNCSNIVNEFEGTQFCKDFEFQNRVLNEFCEETYEYSGGEHKWNGDAIRGNINQVFSKSDILKEWKQYCKIRLQIEQKQKNLSQLFQSNISLKRNNIGRLWWA